MNELLLSSRKIGNRHGTYGYDSRAPLLLDNSTDRSQQMSKATTTVSQTCLNTDEYSRTKLLIARLTHKQLVSVNG
jgi:hypothetical protein